MSTRSFIALHDPETGVIQAIYCHHDGYLDHVGRLLKCNYTELHVVRKLIELGNISSLGRSTDTTEAYARDRGEELEPPMVCSSVESLMKAAFDENSVVYVYVVSDFDPVRGVITGTWKYTARNKRELLLTL